MLSLVRHFGDSEDSGMACGDCDLCAPESSLKTQAAPPGGFATFSAQAKRRGKRPRRSGKSGSRRKARAPAVALPVAGPGAALVATLRAWRLLESKKKRVPAFRVLTNRALVAIAAARPASPAALRQVTGVGPKLLKSYGAQLVALCTRGGD